jgi:hypothetical protein
MARAKPELRSCRIIFRILCRRASELLSSSEIGDRVQFRLSHYQSHVRSSLRNQVGAAKIRLL